jgi:AcrR family transcriptional regulator
MSSDIPPRERILHAAGELFTRHGFADTTMLEIATRARVSKRELYSLVGDKEAMLAACVAGRGSRMRLPEGYPDPVNRAGLVNALRAYGAALLRELTNPEVVATFRLGIAESKRSPAVARTIQEKGREPARAALAALLRSAQSAKLIAAGLEKAPNPKEIEQRAAEATDLFLSLHGR